MALTLEYSVTGLKVKDQVNKEGVTLQNAVVQTYWRVIGTDENGNKGEWAGATPFTAENVPVDSFTSFESLTEENVIEWITAVVDGDQVFKDHILEQLEKDINKHQIKEVSMPWAKDVTPPLPEGTELPEE